jgi:hypothetical protein
MLMSLLGTLCCALMALDQFLKHSSGAHVVGGLLVAVATGLGISMWVRANQPNRRVLLYEHGMIVEDGRAPAAFQWSDMQALHGMVLGEWRGAYAALGEGLSVALNNGRTVGVPLTPDMRDLVLIVQEKHLALHLPAAEATLANGGSLALGPITLDKDGLQAASGRLPWADLERVDVVPEVSGTSLSILRRGAAVPWFTVSLASVPDAALLVQLAARLRPVDKDP